MSALIILSRGSTYTTQFVREIVIFSWKSKLVAVKTRKSNERVVFDWLTTHEKSAETESDGFLCEMLVIMPANSDVSMRQLVFIQARQVGEVEGSKNAAKTVRNPYTPMFSNCEWNKC